MATENPDAEETAPATGEDTSEGPNGSGVLKSALFSVTKGTITTMLGTLGFLILSLTWRVVIVRLISVEEWGQMSLTFAIIAVITTLASLGVNQAVARSIAFENSSEWKGIVYSGILVTSVSGAIFSVALFLLASPIAVFFRDPQLVPVIQILSPSIFLGMFIGTLSAIFQGFKNVFPNALFANVLPNVLSISLALLLYYLGLGFTGILISAVLNTVIVVIIMVPYALKRLKTKLILGVRKNKVRMLIAFGLPLLIVTSLNSIMGYADTLILGYFRTETVVGYYTAGLTLGRIVNFSMSAMGFIFLPVASQLYSLKRNVDLGRTYSTATKWSLMTSIPMLMIFVLYPVRALGFTFGFDYSSASTVLAISASGVFVASLFGPATVSLVAFGRTRLLAINSAIAVGSNLVASFTLIPLYGMTGGAYSSIIGSLTYNVLCLIEVAYYFRLHPFNKQYLRSLVSAMAGSFVILLLLNLHPGLLALPFIFVGVALFVIFCILVTKSVDTTDVLLLEVAEGILGRKLTRLRRLGTLLIGKTS